MPPELQGYSKTPLAKKLGIKPGFKMKLVNAPAYYLDLFTDMPEDIDIIPIERQNTALKVAM